MSRFEAWEQHNLARFAKEANEKLLTQQEEIETLQENLRVALDAYRQLVIKHAGKTN
jgi:hypothetical protein